MVFTNRLKLLTAIAAAVFVYVLASSGPEDSGSVVGASVRTAAHAGQSAAAARGAAARSAGQGADASRPADGNMLQRLAHRVAEGKTVDALFHPQSWYIAPPPPPPPLPVQQAAPPPPTAPPLPFVAMGSYARPGDRKVYFLTRGDRVFDVHVGDSIDNTYSVDSEANGVLTLTYKPLNIQQTLPLGGS